MEKLTKISTVILAAAGAALAVSSLWHGTNLIWATACAVAAVCLHEMDAEKRTEYYEEEEL